MIEISTDEMGDAVGQGSSPGQTGEYSPCSNAGPARN